MDVGEAGAVDVVVHGAPEVGVAVDTVATTMATTPATTMTTSAWGARGRGRRTGPVTNRIPEPPARVTDPATALDLLAPLGAHQDGFTPTVVTVLTTTCVATPCPTGAPLA